MSLKEYIFSLRVRKQPARQAIFPRIDAVRSVLMVYESDMDERNTAVLAIEQELQKTGKDVVMWGYCAKKELTTVPTPNQRIFGKQEVGWLSKPSNDLIFELQKRQYELVIDLTQHPCLPLQYITLYARADFKTGMQLSTNQESDGIHDLLIRTDPQDSPRFLYEQIIKYLTMISPKK